MPHARHASNGSSTAASEVLTFDTLPSSFEFDHLAPTRPHQFTDTHTGSAPPSPAVAEFDFIGTMDTSPQNFNHPGESRKSDGNRTPKADAHTSNKPRDSSKRRTQQYEDHFAYKDDWETRTSDDVRQQSPVILELKTNVIVGLSIII
jgi:hypothetical protein